LARSSLTVSVAQLAVLIRDRAGVVLGVASLVLGAVLAVGYGSELVFVASGQLFLGEVLDAAAEDSSAAHDADGVSGEIDILGSASLVERAILASGLNADVGPADARVARYSEWLAAGRDFYAMPRAENELAVLQATLAGAQPERFVVEFADGGHYLVSAGGEALGEGDLDQPAQLGRVAWTLAAGPARKPRSGARYEVSVTPAGSVVLDVCERLRLSAPRASGSPSPGRIVTLEFTASSPFRAERFVSALLEQYLQNRHDRKVGKLLAREAYLAGESRTVEQALESVEEQMARVRSSQRGLSPDDEDSPLLVERERFQIAEARAALEVARLEVYSQSFAGVTPPHASFMDGESGDTQLEALSDALVEAERDLTDARQRFADGAPQVRELTAQVADRTRTIGRYVEARLSRARERQGVIQQHVQTNDQKLGNLEQKKSELAVLARDQEAYAGTYTDLLQQKGEAALVIARAVSKDRIIDPPRAVLEPASPNFKEALSSGLFGVLVGVLWVLFWRLTAGTVQAESDARRFLGGVPVLGAVPFHERRLRRRVSFEDVIEQARVSGHSPYEEAFRLYGLSLFDAPTEPEQQVVFVTSPGALDGKTSAALALGLALSRRGRRVLIVDGSPPRSSESQEGAVVAGLEDVLMERSNLRGARVRVSAGSGELHFLPAGTTPEQGPSAHADQLRSFLQIARARYDTVLVDVPGHVPSNMMALSGLCDRVLIIVRLRHTRRHALDELLESLPRGRSVALVVDDRRGRRALSWATAPVAMSKERPVAS
jgi:polysaccharide biosynthesis transport protein